MGRKLYCNLMLADQYISDFSHHLFWTMLLIKQTNKIKQVYLVSSIKLELEEMDMLLVDSRIILMYL